MNRRNFLLLTTAGLTATAIPTVYYLRPDIEYDLSLAQPQSLSAILEPETIQAIGEGYLHQNPRESSVRKLVRLLSEEDDPMAANLEQKIAEDFKAGRTVQVDGWVLSVTEARQCALLSLTPAK